MIDCRFKPITAWPKKPTPSHQRRHRFRAKWQQTLDLLETELTKLKARDITIEAFFRPNDIRNDGWPYANAKAAQPGVILKFTTKEKQAEFACDKFPDWQQNLRAIALGLEKLRTIEDYGIVVEEEQQYRGWFKELPAASAADEAVECAKTLIVYCGFATDTAKVLSSREEFDRVWRGAIREGHPDTGGTAEIFGKVIAARDRLKVLKGWN